jgi:hypothetical protein
MKNRVLQIGWQNLTLLAIALMALCGTFYLFINGLIVYLETQTIVNVQIGILFTCIVICITSLIIVDKYNK